MTRLFQAFPLHTERQFGYGFGHLLPADGDHGEAANAGIRDLRSERISARRLSESTVTKEARRKASTRIVAIPAIQEFA